MIVQGLGTAVPALSIEQSVAASVALPLLQADRRQSRLLRALYRRSGVRRRHSVLLDTDADGAVGQRFYRPAASPAQGGPSTAQRMQQYAEHALALVTRACREALQSAAARTEQITHIVTVSCTGFDAPGTDVGLVRRLGLSPDISRTHVGFMGCHGMFNGLDVARNIVGADPEAQVLVAAVEMCSLHFNYSWDSQKLVANSLFADGAAAAVCGPDDGRGGLFRIASTGRRLFPDSAAAMTWRIADHGFEMTLRPCVPDLIRAHVAGWLRDWLGPTGRTPEQIRSWAVHPGGPRVLSAFEQALGLPNGGLEVSRRVLADYGNMSSATIGFILQRILREAPEGPGVAVGFGPGLVAEGFVFEPLAPGKQERL